MNIDPLKINSSSLSTARLQPAESNRASESAHKPSQVESKPQVTTDKVNVSNETGGVASESNHFEHLSQMVGNLQEPGASSLASASFPSGALTQEIQPGQNTKPNILEGSALVGSKNHFPDSFQSGIQAGSVFKTSP